MAKNSGEGAKHALRNRRGVFFVFCLAFLALSVSGAEDATEEVIQEPAGTTLLPGTTVELQPDLQTASQTESESQTRSPTGGVTEGELEEEEEEVEVVTQGRPFNNYTGLSCVPVLPPRRGSFFVEGGTGVSVGSVLAFWCRDGFQLVGSDKIQCSVRNGKAQWSNYLPVCEAIPRPQDRGLRVAVLASVVSGVVILAMSLSFLICCIQERASRLRAKKEGRLRRREKRSSRRSDWEREEGEWESFSPPKIFHLSQRMNPRLAPDSPLYLTGGLSGYENRGYQRSQESLLKASMPGLYRSDSQLYPHVVLQRVPTPTAPSAPPSAPPAPAAPHYLHLPHPSDSASSSPAHTADHGRSHMTPQYPTPTYPPNPAYAAPVYPNPGHPGRPWQ